MLDYVFLDLDGPLLDGKNKHFKLYEELIHKGNGNPISIEKYWNMKRDRISRKILLKESNYQLSYQNFMAGWLEKIESDEYLKFDVLKPNVLQTITSWKSYADKIILVTMRHNYENLIKQLEFFSLHRYLDDVIMCNSLENTCKYDMVKHFIFKKAIFVGDTEEDVETAERMNIKSLGIVNGLRNEKFLKADYLVNEIEDIDLSKFI